MMDNEQIGGVRGNDPLTSHIAAVTVNVTELQQEFMTALKRTGHPLTTTEIANFWNRDRDSFSPRPKGGMLDRHMIVEAGKRQCLNKNGKLRWMIAYALYEWVRTDPSDPSSARPV
jgi:hypothetical protein